MSGQPVRRTQVEHREMAEGYLRDAEINMGKVSKMTAQPGGAPHGDLLLLVAAAQAQATIAHTHAVMAAS